MQKQVLYGKEARDKMLEGVVKITDAVKVTMGAAGRTVLIGNGAYGNDGMVHLPTIVTKDGYTVTKYFQLPDAIENRGAMLIKEAALKTVELAGDATTCTCVLAEAMISAGIKKVNDGANPQQLRKGIERATEAAIAELKKLSTPVSGDNNKIFQVATVSANNDETIGRLIADAFSKIGDYGIIDIEESKGMNTEIKVTEGYKFDRGFVSPLFITNRIKETCEFENPIILLYEKKITHHTQIQKAVELSMQSGKPLLIICEDAEQEGLAFLAMNNIQQRVRVCVVKAPEFGEGRRQSMEDIAVYTGATYISDTRGVGIKEMHMKLFGTAKKVIISKDETAIIEGGGEKEETEKVVADLKSNLLNAESEDDKAPIERRIARLTGAVATIMVGGTTETEMKEKIDRVDDAARATKAAIAEGYVAGGGTALLRISEKLEADADEGMKIVFDALKKPLFQICENAGQNAGDIHEVIKLKDDNYGYNVLTGQTEDMIAAGIIDSTKALRCAISNAASVATMLLLSECLIIDIC